MTIKNFFAHFENKQLSQALNIFNQLDQNKQEAILQQLYYQARNANMPFAVSVLYRKLHEGKTFNDFFNAWLPPNEYTKPFNIGDKKYYNYSTVPTRIVNAINIEDPNEIISIGILWGTEEETKKLLERVVKDKSNQVRHDSISEVADKISSKIYYVKTDTELGC